MNDPKLKLAMAKLLPEKIKHEDVYYSPTFDDHLKDGFFWIETKKEILETEWLYVMQLVEEKLLPAETSRYENYLALEVYEDDKDEYWIGGVKHIKAYCFHATFNQRATAMLKVKQIAAVEVPPTTAANQSSTIPYGEKESR